MNKELYISLITKKLSNQLDLIELKELNSWLNTDKQNTNLLSEITDVWNKTADYKTNISFDANTAFLSFKDRYDIPDSVDSAAPKIEETKSKPKLAKYLLGLFLISLIAFFSTQQISNYFARGTHANEGMAALNIALSPLASATLSPQSSLNFNEDGGAINNFNGQAVIDVEDLPSDSPLVINFSNGAQLSTAGAEVNLQDFNDENQLVADVKTGQATITYNGESYDLVEGSRFVLDELNDEVTLINTPPNKKPFAWKSGTLVFDNTPLSEVFLEIEKFYGVNILVTDDSKLNKHFTASNLKPRSLNECLDLLASSIDMTIRRKGLKNIEVSNIQEGE